MAKLDPEALFKIAATIALADGVLADEERALLDGLARRSGVSPEQAKRWLEEVAASSA